jgi:CBS domain-containing protein
MRFRTEQDALVTEANPDRAERFLHLFNQIDEHLRGMLRERKPSWDMHASFGQVVREASKFSSRVRDRRDDLIEFADLRNALVHTAGQHGIRYLAEPYPEVIEDFERMVEAIINPKRAAQIGSQNPRRFAPESPLSEALEYMRDAGHGQIVVQGDGEAHLLSTRGIANWMGAHIKDGTVSFEGVRIADVQHHQPEGSYDIVSRETTIDDIRARFQALVTQSGERLLALIVTHSGKPTEKAIGIITAWDVVANEE